MELNFEKMFDQKKKDPLITSSIVLTEGSYYPFNSLKGSYLLDAIGVEHGAGYD
jgi:hypothetical protein